MNEGYTSIRIKWKTKDRVIKYGKFEDNIDDVINRVLDKAEGKKAKE